MGFLRDFGSSLRDLASTSVKIQAIARYIRESITAMVAEWNLLSQTTESFISSLDAEVKKFEGDFGYHVASYFRGNKCN